jgi:hypothetical protein
MVSYRRDLCPGVYGCHRKLFRHRIGQQFTTEARRLLRGK